MPDNSSNNKRIAQNTIFLYIRMIFMLGVTLYTSRIVLKVLGVEDFGIYNAVGGFVAMFSIISESLTAAISRFFTYELGKKSLTQNSKEESQYHTIRLRNIFSTSLIILIGLGFLILIICETAGLWFLNNKMVIPEDRLVVANWVYQFSLVTFFVNLLSIPYNAAIIAYEKMSAFAYIGIFQALATLGVAFLIQVSPYDLLVSYAFLLSAIAVAVRCLYGIYCSRNFSETRFKLYFDKDLFSELTSFAGWNFFGAASSVLRTQGINVLINIFCGPAVNAARGIAVQVNAAVTQFTSNFSTAIKPQITKNYATGNTEYLFKLVFMGARFTIYLMIFLCVPIIAEADYILNLWLYDVPEHTIMFMRLVLLYSMIEAMSGTTTTLLLSTGDIKYYQIFVGGLQLMHFPTAYVLLKIGLEPEWTYIGAMIVALCCMMVRLYMAKRMVNMPISQFLRKVFLNVVLVMVCASVFPIAVVELQDSSTMRFFVTGVVSVLSTIVSVYVVGLNKQERDFVLVKMRNLLSKSKNE